jgi:hypothetical protein
MQGRSLLDLFAALLAAGCGFLGIHAFAAEPFTITATNVTMPASGNGSSQFSVTNIPITGTVNIATSYAGTDTGAKMPICADTPPVLYSVKAGGTLTGTIACYPYGAAIPASLHGEPHRSGHLPAAGLALAGALLVGFGFRRGASRGLALTLLAAATLACLEAISACGGNSNAMTPGAYQFTISADNEGTVTPLGQLATTTITVTVR